MAHLTAGKMAYQTWKVEMRAGWKVVQRLRVSQKASKSEMRLQLAHLTAGKMAYQTWKVEMRAGWKVAQRLRVSQRASKSEIQLQLGWWKVG